MRDLVRRLAAALGVLVVGVAVWIGWRLSWVIPASQADRSTRIPADQPDLKLASKSAVLMDAQSGQVLYAVSPDEALPPASVTKLMTLVLALEAVQQGKVSMTDEVVASEHAASMGGSQVWLEVGERMPLRDLLYAVAVGSANDASVAVAEYLAGSEPAFVDLMNRKAQELGMRNTRFANSTGLPPQETGAAGPHVASAHDLALLARAAVLSPNLLDMVSTWEYTMRPQGIRKPILYNFNRMLKRYPGVDGLKTGMTSEAGYCVAITAVRDNLRLIAVTMAAPTAQGRESDIRALLDWGFRRYEARRLAKAGDVVATADVMRGSPRFVPLILAQDAFMTVERGSRLETERAVELPPVLVAPLDPKRPAGRVRILEKATRKVLAEVPVQTSVPVVVAPLGELISRQLGSLISVWLPVSRKPASPQPK